MTEEKQQSPNWDIYAGRPKHFYNVKKKVMSRLHFDEKFPKVYEGIKYELILSTGERCTAKVNDSGEYFSEGLEWELLTPIDNHSAGNNIEKYDVAAWREI